MSIIKIDYELDDELDAGTPQRMRALGDPLRKAICDLVLERAMTIGELAARFGRPRGSVAYHVKVLEEAGLLKVVRTRKVRAITERFYGRTARTFKLSRAAGTFPYVDEFQANLDPNGPLDTGFSTLRRARIPPDRIREYEDRLMRLAVEFSEEPREGDVEYSLLIVAAPTLRFAP